MKRGEVWRARFPTPTGHAQAGERPAIVVQNDSVTARVPTVLVVPLTGTLTTTRFPGTLVIQPDTQNGLTIPSVALVFQTQVLDQTALLRRMGELDAATLDQIVALLESIVR